MTSNNGQTIYELGFLLVPSLTENEVATMVGTLKDTISKDGSILSEGSVVFIDLAYEMVKKIKSKNERFDQAHFGWIKFTMDGSSVSGLDKALKAHDDLLRFLVIKTVEDDAVTDLFELEDTEESAPVDLNKGVDMGDDKADDKTDKKEEVSEEKVEGDDLTKIEGIGPKIAETLTAAGVSTFAELSKTDSDKIQEIIADVRGNHVSDTWPKQASMAAEGKWDELKAWQDEMDGGRES